MLSATIFIALFCLFCAASIYYVYAFRGQARFADFVEYFRKGWPIFAPFNCLLYLFTQSRANKPIMNVNDFPELNELQRNWQTVREEVLNLYQKNYFSLTKQEGAAAAYDIGFRTFYKYGWSKFYLKWYGYTHASALELCPNTVKILDRIPQINGAMFSVLPPGSQLTRHLDPVACSLRYHLGLKTPNHDKCFINVDGQSYSWRDGEGFLFDETYLHYAKNDTDDVRLILMCDFNRPLHYIGSFINLIYKSAMRTTVVPNLSMDKKGLVNQIFASLAPLLKRSKKLKETNFALYKVLKYTINTVLLLIVLAILAAIVTLFTSIF